MSNTFIAKRVNKLTILCLGVILCLLMTTYWLWWQAKTADEKLLEQQFTLSLKNLSQKIDARVAGMKLIAKTIANDKHIHQWVDTGFAANQESILVDKLGFLVNQYGLTSASFVDKNSHKYWNHEGFLRVLQPDVDTWYFAYLASDNTDLISVYHDRNKKRVDIYVNYQQPEGNGLSGIATSFDGVVDILDTSIFASYGELYLVDSSGKIQVHSSVNQSNLKNLSDMLAEDIVESLLQPSSTGLIEIENKLVASSYIPSIDWYAVVNVALQSQ